MTALANFKRLAERHKKLAKEPFPTLGPDVPLNWISEQDALGLGHSPWDIDAWVEKGYKRNWGDAAITMPWFEVLRYEDDEKIEYLVLCTALRRAARYYFDKQRGTSWGSF